LFVGIIGNLSFSHEQFSKGSLPLEQLSKWSFPHGQVSKRSFPGQLIGVELLYLVQRRKVDSNYGNCTTSGIVCMFWFSELSFVPFFWRGCFELIQSRILPSD